jgi:hypothetical protein
LTRRRYSRIGITVAIAIAAVIGGVSLFVRRDKPASSERSTLVETVPSQPPAIAERTVTSADNGTAGQPSGAAPTRATASHSSHSAQEEAAIMAKLHELKFSNPPVSLELARQGNERFPSSHDAPERAWFEARSLVEMQRFEEAQAVARDMLERYPGTPWSLDVAKHLLTHPFGLPPRPH